VFGVAIGGAAAAFALLDQALAKPGSTVSPLMIIWFG